MEYGNFLYGIVAGMGILSFTLFVSVILSLRDLQKRMNEFEKKHGKS